MKVAPGTDAPPSDDPGTAPGERTARRVDGRAAGPDRAGRAVTKVKYRTARPQLG